MPHAADTGLFARIAIPSAATLRAALMADFNARRQDDAAMLADHLRKLGLTDEADALQRAHPSVDQVA